MYNFFSKADYTKADLDALITSNSEESIYLDFKSADSLSTSEGKKSEIAKDVSAFANSDGGIIIYGIKEIDHKAECYSYIDGRELTKEWLEQVIQSRISRRIPEIRIFPIRIDSDILKSVYVVKIPASNLAPHMTSEKRYYKRYNFSSVQMEEYEIRALYFRQSKTELEIVSCIFREKDTYGSPNAVRYFSTTMDFQIQNISNSIESQYKLEVSLPTAIILEDVRNPINPYLIRQEGGISIFSIPSNSPIFPGEITTVGSAQLGFDIITIDDSNMVLKLYYTNGIKEKTIALKDTIEYQGKLLNELPWSF